MGAILNISFGRSPLLILSFRRSPFWPKTLFLKVVVQISGSLIQVHKSLCSFSTLFSTYSTCFGKWIIKVFDGPFSSIVGQGIVQLNLTLVSKSIWHVPNLSYNLQFIGNLTKDLHCSMLFTSFGRIFQDFVMEMMIEQCWIESTIWIPVSILVPWGIKARFLRCLQKWSKFGCGIDIYDICLSFCLKIVPVLV